MAKNPDIASALKDCNAARTDILTSMVYQMGVSGLADFHDTLKLMAIEEWEAAADAMLR
ncbi:glycoside hydrolase family protein [Klebsiella sp. CN_Kp098]|uniref:glycoside hydrolase family protein n=1 Tax=unclassified Klebsiella TaxID=2608929 RepID=UPI0032B5AC7C